VGKSSTHVRPKMWGLFGKAPRFTHPFVPRPTSSRSNFCTCAIGKKAEPPAANATPEPISDRMQPRNS
jgi:hypothetical protein